MDYEIVGLENMDYMNRAGRRVVGCKLHLVSNGEMKGENRVGRSCLSVWCGTQADVDPGISVGRLVRVYYDQRGYVASVVCVG